VYSMLNIKFNRNQIHKRRNVKLLYRFFQYSIEKPLATYFTILVSETKYIIKFLDAQLLNTDRILATKQLKRILNSN
jgi:hypothetical protein